MRNTSTPGEENEASAVLLHPSDNVICLLRDHQAGERPIVSQDTATSLDLPSLTNDAPLGHKIAICDIPQSSYVVKYGYAIGRSTEDINAGDHVHLQNLVGKLPGGANS